MVKQMVIAGVLLCTPLICNAENSNGKPLSAADLARMSGVTNYEHEARSKRLKSEDIRSLLESVAKKGDEVIFRKPDGSYVPGYLLPSGVVVPRFGRGSEMSPGCMAQNGKVYPAQWDGKKLNCIFPQDKFYAVHQTEAAATASKKESQQSGTSDTLSSGDTPLSVDKPKENESPKLSKYVANPQGKDAVKSRKQVDKEGVKQRKTKTIKKERVQVNNRSGVEVSHASAKNSVGSVSSVEPFDDSTETPFVYVAQTFSRQSVYSSSSSVKVDKALYGLPINTWIEGELRRPVTSVDNGLIEVIITKEVIGKYDSIPAGSVLYAAKAFNMGTKRMDITVKKGVSPDGKEFELFASGFDASKQSGLFGTVVRNRTEEFKSAGTQTAFAATGDLMGAVGGDLVGNSIQSMGDQLLKNEKRYTNRAPEAYIKVAPQLVFLRLDEPI